MLFNLAKWHTNNHHCKHCPYHLHLSPVNNKLTVRPPVVTFLLENLIFGYSVGSILMISLFALFCLQHHDNRFINFKWMVSKENILPIKIIQTKSAQYIFVSFLLPPLQKAVTILIYVKINLLSSGSYIVIFSRG